MTKKIITAALAAMLILAAYAAGHREGKRHVIEDSAIWTVEVYDPDNDAYPLGITIRSSISTLTATCTSMA